ncbi:adenosylmethionine--8-amino-7-oxononanoate transaminase [Robiginitalea marina]|uniref:Adenosylmethionine-8-amino-7-oxononanoate aminotransferase n=1 Tax=Robiginitalea marina TaxID=2954105 RepID=A0ABT1AXT0_9FLAO|nr:adenosylmethionine--8-amino-7-oxononanoate transaminase [Robiginitalea marina]MCO5724499.1 adenosylmethionine--8-amino-7-oxononanoate transaminase [Robiginitalea marina]
MKSLSQRDRNYIWHPLTQHKTHPEVIGIRKAEGVYLYDEEGKGYIDGISSWYTAVYGHCNPFITGRVARQMEQLDQVVFSGFTHEPAVSLSEKLIPLLPGNQARLFFSDNGSTAVEVAIKMALQYHFNRGERRKVLLAFEEGFHGDTFGAMSVSGLSVYNGPFADFSLEVRRIPVPDQEEPTALLTRLEELLETESVAAFVYEPLVQGAAAMKMHNARGLDRVLGCLREKGVLLVADEVMTGFGKTGTHFASGQLKTQPDILCLSKALTAGLLPMAVTSCTAAVFDAFYGDDLSLGFFHGHTYTANPLACTAALAGLELLVSEPIQEGIRRIMHSHGEFLRRVDGHPAVRASRQCGVILALDLDAPGPRYGAFRDRAMRFFMERGVYLRPLGNTVYVLPPYVIRREELQKIYGAIEALLEQLKA